MIKVFKIGGNVINDPKALDAFVADFAHVEGPKILVHGGGDSATNFAKKLNVYNTMVEGRRVTNTDMIKIVTQIYAGQINKDIVCRFSKVGVSSFGFCGVDGMSMRSVRRVAGSVDFGFVGDLDETGINTTIFMNLINSGILSVIAPITIGAEYEILNTNADTVAQSIAVALSKEDEVELVYCFEKDGVLRDVSDASTLIKDIDLDVYRELRDKKIVFEGMIPKIDNAFTAISRGVKRVCMCSSKNILQEGYGGTVIVR
ncbi:MAG: acetylglutamate kinase [Rikenellaceae bacterium]